MGLAELAAVPACPGWTSTRSVPRASWYRWVTLAMLACAFLTVTAATEHGSAQAPPGQIPLTRRGVATIFGALVIETARD